MSECLLHVAFRVSSHYTHSRTPAVPPPFLLTSVLQYRSCTKRAPPLVCPCLSSCTQGTPFSPPLFSSSIQCVLTRVPSFSALAAAPGPRSPVHPEPSQPAPESSEPADAAAVAAPTNAAAVALPPLSTVLSSVDEAFTTSSTWCDMVSCT